MKWENLKSMICPKPGCGGTLQAANGNAYRCGRGKYTSDQCEFYITKDKFDKVIVSLYSPGRGRDLFPGGADNSSELNNLDLGRKQSDFEGMPSRGED